MSERPPSTPVAPAPSAFPPVGDVVTQPKTIPSGTPRQWRERTVFTFHCLRCRKALRDTDDYGDAWFSGEEPITSYEVQEEQGWADIDDAWYCPDCFHTCWEADGMPRIGRETACKVCKAAGGES